jgi:hypothetical protein
MRNPVWKQLVDDPEQWASVYTFGGGVNWDLLWNKIQPDLESNNFTRVDSLLKRMIDSKVNEYKRWG